MSGRPLLGPAQDAMIACLRSKAAMDDGGAGPRPEIVAALASRGSRQRAGARRCRLLEDAYEALSRKVELKQSDATVEGFAVVSDQSIAKLEAAHAFEKDGASSGFRQPRDIAEPETRISDRPVAYGIEKLPEIVAACVVKTLQHRRDRRPPGVGAKETILVSAILGEQQAQPLAVIRGNGSGKCCQEIGERQSRSLVLAVSALRDHARGRDPGGADHGNADADARVRFQDQPRLQDPVRAVAAAGARQI